MSAILIGDLEIRPESFWVVYNKHGRQWRMSEYEKGTGASHRIRVRREAIDTSCLYQTFLVLKCGH